MDFDESNKMVALSIFTYFTCFCHWLGEPVDVMININIRSLGPISEMDMVSGAN